MLVIKTITHKVNDKAAFDKEVNDALAEGWELVKRELLPPFEGPTRFWERALYAELERVIEEEEEEEPEDDGTAEWVVSRNPSAPYRCNKCEHSTATPAPRCPGCGRTMVSYR